MEYLELRSKIIDTRRRLRSAGYVFGTWGNAGVRLDDGNILITPSRVDYDELLPEDLPVLAPDGSIVSGSRLPTSEREIHRGILNARRVMIPLMQYVDVCIGNEEDAEKVLGFKPANTDITQGQLDIAAYQDVFRRMRETFGFRYIGSTLRESYSASDNGWSAMIYDGTEFYRSRKYDSHLVDRGGITPENAAEFIRCGACAVSGARTFMNFEKIQKEGLRAVTDQVARFIRIIRETKQDLPVIPWACKKNSSMKMPAICACKWLARVYLLDFRQIFGWYCILVTL